MNWQEFNEHRLPLSDNPSREEWQAALDHARSLLPQVDEADRQQAEEIVGDTLIQAGIWLDYVDEEGEVVMTRQQVVELMVEACQRLDRSRPFTQAQWEAEYEAVRRANVEHQIDLEPLSRLGLYAE